MNVSLPKFKATTQLQLSDSLKSMGMASAFDAAKADLSGMTGDRNFCISAVIHKAFVDVNEEGTEAAAATAVVMARCSASFDEPQQKPRVFCADHPFVFLIRDSRTGSILFLGRVIDPTSSSDWSPQVGQFKSSAAPWLPTFPARDARPVGDRHRLRLPLVLKVDDPPPLHWCILGGGEKFVGLYLVAANCADEVGLPLTTGTVNGWRPAEPDEQAEGGVGSHEPHLDSLPVPGGGTRRRALCPVADSC